MIILPLLVKASTQSHDEERLRAELAAGFTALWCRLPRQPFLSPRQRRLVEHPAKLKPMDADALIDAVAEIVGWSGHGLSADLIALTLIVARLGGVSAAVRIGLLAVGDLKGRIAVRRGTLH